MTDERILARRFEEERPRLRAIARQILGSDADADDAVQETWLRLERVDTDDIRNIDAWLTTVISRVSLDMLRAPRRSRERSWQVEPWRDEPVATGSDPADVVADADRVNVALMVVLDTLAPSERIAFVLHDVFGQPFDEVAAVLEKSPEAARQLASRARRRLRDAPVSRPRQPVTRQSRRVVEAWLSAAQGGDLAALLALLDDSAVLQADYGTGTRTIEGARDIVAQAALAARLAAHSTPVLIGGLPGVAAVLAGRVVSLMAFDVDEDRIIGLHVLADPERLAGLGVERVLGGQ
ncbi:sigma-70 family RNA polymerase sigma factor [Micromonospora sp. DT81.3]|uniref:sigma-70 family RNA polymerase sigma factor n=1 Tax=Micromonospora sp. DT81.3 TaxID=3416523 RepID=UPI003CF4824D